MKITLTDCVINTDEIKQLRKRPIKLLAGINTKIKPHYSIEFINGNFKVITKQEYKLIKKAINEN